MKPTAYILQAALIFSWWVAMFANADFYAAFQFAGIPPLAFNALLLPDLLLVGVASLVRAYRAVPRLEYVILGGFAYAALYCVNATLLTNSGYLPTTIMCLGLGYNLFLVFEKWSFRTASQASFSVNFSKTVAQIFCVWLITLGLFPYLLLLTFSVAVRPAGNSALITAALLFAAASTLGLYSAYVMVRHGEGTPLPLDQTRRLVVAGPYRFVRNPMAVAGILQGIAISLAFQSRAVLLYAILGAIVWHVAVRPAEERNLQERFGAEYDRYRKAVRCWWPRLAGGYKRS